jgi:ribose 5-phosphate isomerase B
MSKAVKIYAACDHAGLELKKYLITNLPRQSGLTHIEWVDLGTNDSASVDYPDFADRVAGALKKDPESFGLLVCGSGQGMAIGANRHKHIRAALCWAPNVAELARGHNDANVLCLGARLIEPLLALQIATQFYKTNFEGDRHARRVEKLAR